jgi:hypothetical protein
LRCFRPYAAAAFGDFAARRDLRHGPGADISLDVVEQLI